MRRGLHYVWNLIVVVGWTLLLIAGAVCGVDRQRLLKVLRPTRKASRKSQPLERVEPSAPAGPQLVNEGPSICEDVLSALHNLDVAKPDAKRMVNAATTAGCSTFDQIFGHAVASQRRVS